MLKFKKIYGVLFSQAISLYNHVIAHLLRYPDSKDGYEAISRNKMIQYNKVRNHGAKKLFCYNPFVNIFFNISGHAIACCRSHKTILGKYPNQSIQEIWFGKRFEAMRDHLSHNDLNMGCEYCKMQLKSNRFHALPSMAVEKYASDKSGIYPRTMELELSNKCNLQCIMCTGRVSSSIRKHREKLPPIEFPYDDRFLDQLKTFMPHLKNMYFYGGEPFLIDIYYKIWAQVMKINPKIKLYAVTNGTIFNKRIEEILNATEFNVTISLDSMKKERFEYIRKGADFEKVMENIKKFQSIIMGNLAISHTPMQANWVETPEIINFCNRINARVNLSYVENPSHLALWACYPKKLDEIYHYYDKVKWKSAQNKITAKYNIMVFNEWKEQVKYFRDKNRRIIESYGNYPLKIKDMQHALMDKYKTIESKIPNGIMSFEQVFNVLDSEILSKPDSPVKLEVIAFLYKRIKHENFLDDKNTIKTLSSPEKFKEYIKKHSQENEFWSKHYSTENSGY